MIFDIAPLRRRAQAWKLRNEVRVVFGGGQRFRVGLTQDLVRCVYRARLRGWHIVLLAIALVLLVQVEAGFR